MGKIWSPDQKVWSPNKFIIILYNSHRNIILYFTLHARKVKRGRAKRITNRISETYMYKATVTMR